MHATVRGVCDRVLLPNCERYQLHLGQVIRIMPGQAAQPIHRDRWAWGARLRGVEPQLNTIWALTDFTTDNGATQVVPGSSEWPDDRKAEPDEITQAVMDAGSVLIYTGTVFHGGGENRSDGDRTGLNITYTLGWLRQEENQYLSCPPEIARTLDPELQALIGYSMGQYALGYYTRRCRRRGPEVSRPSTRCAATRPDRCSAPRPAASPSASTSPRPPRTDPVAHDGRRAGPPVRFPARWRRRRAGHRRRRSTPSPRRECQASIAAAAKRHVWSGRRASVVAS